MTDSRSGVPTRRSAQPRASPAAAPQQTADPPSENEILERAAELLRPLMRDPAQAPQTVARMVAEVEMFRGPLPHPGHLQAYNEIIPGGGQEILEMAKREQRHRHRMHNLE